MKSNPSTRSLFGGYEVLDFSDPIMLGNRAQLLGKEFIMSKIKKVLLGILLTVTNTVCIIMFFLTVGKEAGGFIFETWMAITASISSTFFFWLYLC